MPKLTRYVRLLCGAASLLLPGASLAADQDTPLPELIRAALAHSRDRAQAKADTASRRAEEKATSLSRLVPQLNLTGVYQSNRYKNLVQDAAGNAVSNDGHNFGYDVTATYDLQRLLGPESSIAALNSHFGEVQERFVERQIVRDVKQAYYSIAEIGAELAELKKLIGLFSRIEGILTKQKKLGVANALERRQFALQQSLLLSDLSTRNSDLDAAYAGLSTLLNADPRSLPRNVPGDLGKPSLPYADGAPLDPEALASAPDEQMIENLKQDSSLAAARAQEYNPLPLPLVYAKAGHAAPTWRTGDGPQTNFELGITLSLDGFLTRPAQLDVLQANAEKLSAASEKSLLDYRNQIRLAAANLQRFREQRKPLADTREEADDLLNRSFEYYAQRRIDVLGTLDLFQKHLSATRALLQNQQQLANADAQLEYLLGSRR